MFSSDFPNPYLEEIFHHRHQLQTTNQFDAVLESKQTILEFQAKDKLKYIKENENLKMEMQRLEEICQQEIAILKQKHQVQVLSLKAQIANLKTKITIIMDKYKQDRDMRRQNQKLKKQVEDYLEELAKKDEQITRIKDEKELYHEQLILNRRQIKQQEVKDQIQKSQMQRLELQNQQILHKMKLLKQQLNQERQIRDRMKLKMQEIVHDAEKTKSNLEDKINVKETEKLQYQKNIINLQRQLVLAKKDIEFMEQNIQDLTKKQQPKSQPNQKKRKVREREQDPEQQSLIHKNIDLAQQRSNYPRTSRQNKRNISRERSTLQTGHHCLCLRSQRYKNKLKEANQKIVQLLAEKCRRGIQTSFQSKTSKRNFNTTLDL